MKINIINGPNLNFLGERETDIYGDISFEHFFLELKKKFSEVEFSFFQSNVEGEIITEIQNSKGGNFNAIILNAAAYTHYSIAIRDAILSVNIPTIEVHISNIFSREEFRHKSVISPVCKGIISGFGLQSYELAVLSLIKIERNL